MTFFYSILLFLISISSCFAEAKKAATVQEMTDSIKNGGRKSSLISYGFYGLYGQDVANDDIQLNSRIMSFYTLGVYSGIKLKILSLDYLINYSINKQNQDSSRYGFTDLSGKNLYSGIRLNFKISSSNSIGAVYYLNSIYQLDKSFQNTSQLVMSQSKNSFSIQLNQQFYKKMGLIFDYTVLNYIIDDNNSLINGSASENVRISIGFSFFN